AAHLANAGVPVLLLDLKDFAAQSLEKLKKSRPASFSHVRNSLLVQTGNLETDLAKVADCDLIVEAIIEKLEIKRDLFAKLDALLTGDTIVASNTSGLRIADMLVGRSERFRQNFVVTHFFNPPRYMKLLELVAGP